MVSKLYALKGEKFDISKVTVVGSPTITSDGVASGFTASDYINCGNVLNPASVDELEIKARVKLESTSKTERFIGIITGVGSTNGISINRYAGSSSILRFLVQNNANSKVSIDVPIQLGIYNDLCLKWNSTNNTLFAYLNEILIGTAILAEGITGDYSNAILQLGALQTNYNEFLNGSIDLKEFKVYVDNQLVFQPVKPTYLLERRKEGYDSSKFTIVGSPTITEYGVASGFSGSSYIKVPTTFNKPFKLSIPFITGNSVTESTAQYILLSNNRALQIYISFDGKLAIKVGTTAWGTDILHLTNTTLKTNTSYIFELEFTGTQYKITLNNDLLSTVDSSSLILEETESAIGSYPNYEQSFIGSIDLPSFSITVDGKEIFTGAKEKFYALKR